MTGHSSRERGSVRKWWKWEGDESSSRVMSSYFEVVGHRHWSSIDFSLSDFSGAPWALSHWQLRTKECPLTVVIGVIDLMRQFLLLPHLNGDWWKYPRRLKTWGLAKDSDSFSIASFVTWDSFSAILSEPRFCKGHIHCHTQYTQYTPMYKVHNGCDGPSL